MHLDAANGRWSAETIASPHQSDSLERTSCLFDLPRPPFGHVDAGDADSDTTESLRVAHDAGALRSQDLKRVTVDTTVQPKPITFQTDAKLLHAAIKGLNRLARSHGVRLWQSYSRVAKLAAMMAGRYAHAKQFRRHQRQLRILRSRLKRDEISFDSLSF